MRQRTICLMFFIGRQRCSLSNRSFLPIVLSISQSAEKCYKLRTQSNCRIIPKKLRDMKREEICRLLADKLIN